MTRMTFVFGASRFSVLVARLIELETNQEFGGFVVDERYMNDDNQLPAPLVSYKSMLELTEKNRPAIVSSIGYLNMENRARCFRRLRRDGFEAPSLIHPDACVDESVDMGANNIVMAGAVIEPGVRLGDNNTIWSNVTVCHDATLGSHNFLAANAVIGGETAVGDRNFFGFSSVTTQKISVGDGNVLGSLSMLHRDCGSGSVWLGSPAKRKSSIEAGNYRIE